MKLQTRESGYTLIELIMTMMIIGIVGLPLFMFTAQHMETVIRNGEYNQASHLAKYEIERIKNLPYASIVSSAPFPDPDGLGYQLTRTVAYIEGSGTSAEGLKEVVIDVRRNAATPILVTIKTYVADNVAYGL